MRGCAAAGLLWIAGVASGAVGGASEPASTAPSRADRLAVQCLNHAARSLGHLRDDSVVARVGRIRTLLRCAERLCPDDVQTNRQLVDLYEGLGEVKLASAAAERCLRACPGDYGLAIRWIRLSRATLDRADERIALLERIAARRRLLPEVRAAAMAELAAIRLRQADEQNARSACQAALRLDPYQPTALRVRARTRSNNDPILSFEDDLAVFRGNPRSLEAAWKLAQRLQAAGAYDEALVFYEHARALSRDRPPAGKVVEKLLIDYVNDMLDAGRPAKAMRFFAPLVREYGYSLALRALMVEACRSLKKDDQAASHVKFMERVYRPAARNLKASAAQAAEVAWFNLRYQNKPKVALERAKAAALSDGDDPYVQRVLGACQILAGDVAAGRKLLEPLAEKDPFAAATLARHHYARKAPAAGRRVLLRAAGCAHTGPAWRELAAVAAKHEVILPSVPHAEAFKQAAKKLPSSVLTSGRRPERFVRVKLTPAAKKVALGEPVAITVELKNISTEPLALGADGLLTPVVSLSLAVEGAVSATFPDLAAVRLPAPKYLPAGGNISETVRVDVGPAEEFLMTYPLANLKLRVSGMLDPLQHKKEMISSAPGVRIVPVMMSRPALFGVSGGKTAAQYALGYIVGDLKQGDLPTRLAAARKTASLLARLRRVELGKTRAAFPQVLTKPILLSMTRAFLRAPSPLVRAEMLAALHHVDLDEQIIALMGPTVQDPAGLVRMRLIELLAANRTPGRQTLVELFAKDADPSVREMSAAVGRGK